MGAGTLGMRWWLANAIDRWRRRVGLGLHRPPSAPIDRKAPFCTDVTALVFTCDPSPLLEECLAAVRSQTLPARRIEIVRNVMPISRAFQEGLDRVETPYFVSVDDDMILHPRCFEQLHYLLTRSSNRAEVVLGLEDPLLGIIQGIHFYRTSAVAPIGFHPCDEKGPERRLSRKLRAAGYETLADISIVAGRHHPVYTPLEVFWKYRFYGESVLHYPSHDWSYAGTSRLFYFLDNLSAYWLRSGDLLAVYALAGVFEGLSRAHDCDRPLSYEGRERNPEFERLHDFLKDFENLPRTSGSRRRLRSMRGWRRRVASRLGALRGGRAARAVRNETTSS
jgi:hypothetical protein